MLTNIKLHLWKGHFYTMPNPFLMKKTIFYLNIGGKFDLHLVSTFSKQRTATNKEA